MSRTLAGTVVEQPARTLEGDSSMRKILLVLVLGSTSLVFAQVAKQPTATKATKAAPTPDARLREACSAQAPKDAEMSARHDFIDACVADAKVREACAAQVPRDAEMSTRHELVDTCVRKQQVKKLRDQCSARVPKDAEMSTRHELVDACVEDKVREQCRAKVPKDAEMSTRHEIMDTCVEEMLKP
jgi:hypothetical protein